MAGVSVYPVFMNLGGEGLSKHEPVACVSVIPVYPTKQDTQARPAQLQQILLQCTLRLCVAAIAS